MTSYVYGPWPTSESPSGLPLSTKSSDFPLAPCASPPQSVSDLANRVDPCSSGDTLTHGVSPPKGPQLGRRPLSVRAGVVPTPFNRPMARSPPRGPAESGNPPHRDTDLKVSFTPLHTCILILNCSGSFWGWGGGTRWRKHAAMISSNWRNAPRKRSTRDTQQMSSQSSNRRWWEPQQQERRTWFRKS